MHPFSFTGEKAKGESQYLVITAEAGIQILPSSLDPGFRRGDDLASGISLAPTLSGSFPRETESLLVDRDLKIYIEPIFERSNTNEKT